MKIVTVKFERKLQKLLKEKGKAISVQTETYELVKSAFKNIPIMWLFASIFLTTNINNFGLCRLSVSIYLSPIGNFFFSILLVVSYIFRLCRKSINLIQTFLTPRLECSSLWKKKVILFRLCRLSVIYLSAFGYCFFVLLVVKSISRPLSLVS